MVDWWHRLGSDLTAVDRAIERQHQAAIATGKPWPPEHKPQQEPTPVSGPESSPGSGRDNQMAKLVELLAQTTEAAERFTAEKADREARAEYAARLEREAYTEPERTLQTEAEYEAGIEL